MCKFSDDDIDFLEAIPEEKMKPVSMAGGDYMNHLDEIGKMIDKLRHDDVLTYQAAHFCSVVM